MIRYSILMPFFNRHLQLRITLQSFAKYYSNRDDVEVVIVIDAKTEEGEDLDALRKLRTFNGIPIKVVEGGSCFSPSSHYNQAARVAAGLYYVFTSPEIMHTSDVLKGFDDHLRNRFFDYVIASCGNGYPEMKMGVDHKILNSCIPLQKYDQRRLAWYQHSIQRPSNYNFCSVIHKSIFKDVDGWDEQYSDGVGYDDNDWRDSLEMLEVPFVAKDDLITIHQYHEKIMTPERRRLTKKNRDIYIKKCKQRNLPVREN